MTRAKVLSTPEDYSQGIANGLQSAADGGGVAIDAITQIMHGTTVATNALLEGKGAKVALVTTEGFRDVLEIRRLRMPVLYDIRWSKPPALVPRRLRFEVPERIDHLGRVERPSTKPRRARSSSACWRSRSTPSRSASSTPTRTAFTRRDCAT